MQRIYARCTCALQHKSITSEAAADLPAAAIAGGMSTVTVSLTVFIPTICLS